MTYQVLGISLFIMGLLCVALMVKLIYDVRSMVIVIKAQLLTLIVISSYVLPAELRETVYKLLPIEKE